MSKVPSVQTKNHPQWNNVCIDCGVRTKLVTHNFSLSFLNPVNYLWVFLTPAAFLIARLVFRKKLEVESSICVKCNKKQQLWKKLGLASIVVLVINLIVGFNLENPSLLFFNAITLATIILSLISYHKVKHGLKISAYNENTFIVSGFSKPIVARINRKLFP